jgi:MerR family transcriptional regulator, light-induced transcriptional regulator
MYAMNVVARLTGIPANTIRAWERRYGAVEPARDGNARRAYSAADVHRLRLLKRLTVAGHAIGRIAKHPTPHLEGLVAEADALPLTATAINKALVDRILRAAEHYDIDECQQLIGTALVALPPLEAVRRVLSPLMTAVGDAWECGEYTVAQEHAVTATVKRSVLAVVNTYRTVARGPLLTFATLSGERHELGALFATYIAAGFGLRCTYLGPDLPPTDFVGALRRIKPHVVGISVVHKPADCDMAGQIAALGREVPDGVAIWLGGAALLRVLKRKPPPRCRLIRTIDDYELCLAEVRGG